MSLTNQVHSIIEVTVTADAGGDLTRITVDACGEILDFKETVKGTTEFFCACSLMKWLD